MLKLLVKCIYLYFSILFARKNKKSVLIIPHFTSYGGTKTYFISLIKFLSSSGYNIQVLLISMQLDEEIILLKQAYPFTVYSSEFDIWRTSFSTPVFSKRNKTFFIYQLKELIFFWQILLKSRSSTLICSVANPEEVLFLFISPVKFLYVLHTATMDKLDRVKRLIINLSTSKKKQIVSVSHFCKKLILKNWTNGKKGKYIEVVHNYFEPSGTAIVGKSMPIPIILTVAATEPYKNPFLWIEVCKDILKKYQAPVQFIWAGDGSLLKECREQVRDLEQIRFIGFQKNIEELYAQCSIYFQPSVHESHGISVLGAMYYEKPCVVSNAGGLPESVVNNETGYVVDIENKEGFVTALVLILTNPTLGLEMGKNGKKRFDDLFSFETWKNKMQLILN